MNNLKLNSANFDTDIGAFIPPSAVQTLLLDLQVNRAEFLETLTKIGPNKVLSKSCIISLQDNSIYRIVFSPTRSLCSPSNRHSKAVGRKEYETNP